MGRLIEFILPTMMPTFEYQVIEREEMGGDEARTYPDKGIIKIREDVYDALCSGDGRAQFTIAHEIGHLVLHTGMGENQNFARSDEHGEHKVFEDSEWQADTFAAELLMPYEEARKCSSAHEIKDKFGVSLTAAELRYKKTH